MNGTANYQINNSINCDSMVFPDIIKIALHCARHNGGVCTLKFSNLINLYAYI